MKDFMDNEETYEYERKMKDDIEKIIAAIATIVILLVILIVLILIAIL